jgi:hypothetical protein
MSTATFAELAFQLADTEEELDALVAALHRLRSGE